MNTKIMSVQHWYLQ